MVVVVVVGELVPVVRVAAVDVVVVVAQSLVVVVGVSAVLDDAMALAVGAAFVGVVVVVVAVLRSLIKNKEEEKR